MESPRFLSAVVGWLRAGYPEGVPVTDYVPLLALLRRRLTDDEVTTVVSQLSEHGLWPIEVTDIRVTITKITNEMPSEFDVARVLARLEAIGWPVAGPPDSAHNP